MRLEKITEIGNLLQQEYANTAGIVVLKQGKKVYEHYLNGCTADSPLHIFSATKSVVSLLIGIALDQGAIQSVDQKVFDFFPEYEFFEGEQVKKNVTIRQLLTMTAPYKHEVEPYEDYFMSDNHVRFALDHLGGSGSEAAGTFRYAPLVGPDILTGILVKATGKSVLAFATETLFAQLGISVERTLVFQNQQEQFAFYEAKDISGWVADAAGVNTAGWGLTLTTEDMAKIGQLYMNEGLWQGQRIVSTQWLKDSTTEHSRWQEQQLGYGYLWWVLDHGFAAMGDGGNVIYVDPESELVIAASGLYVSEAKDRIGLIDQQLKPLFAGE